MTLESATAKVRQIPGCKEGFLGIPEDATITDIIAPQLMDVKNYAEVSYEVGMTIEVDQHKSEYGYPGYGGAGNATELTVSQPPKRGILRLLKLAT